MNLIPCLSFFISCCGYLAAINKKTKINVHFIPLICICGISLVLYLGGLLGLLELSAALVCTGGLICSTAVLLFHRGPFRLPVTLCGVCFAAGTLLFTTVILKLNLLHYDNFSHWALIEKYLLSADRFPGPEDTILSFPDYPPGTAVYLYYVCKFLGRGQSIMLLAQNSLLFSCFYAVFGIVREHRRFLLYSFLAMGCAILSYLNLTIRINNLLVDFLLPLLTLASVAISYRHRSQLRLSVLCSALVLGFTGIVKETGIIFAGIGLFCCLWNIFHAEPYCFRKKVSAGTLAFAASLLPILLWKSRMNTVFAGYEGKFELGKTGSGTSHAADPSLYPKIIRDFLLAATDPSQRSLQIFVLFHAGAVLAVLYAGIKLKKKWNLRKVLPAADLMVLFYYGGILYLYLYLMPEEEALVLAGMERYACSIMTLYAGILILCTVTDMENSFAVSIDEQGAYRAYSSPAAKRRYQNGVLLTLIVALNFLFSEINGLLSIQSAYSESLPGRIRQITGDRWYPDGMTDDNRYLIAATDRNSQISDWSVWYISKYYLFAPQITVTDHLNKEAVDKAGSQYDFIFVLEEEAVNFGGDETYKGIGRTPGIYRTVSSGS